MKKQLLSLIIAATVMSTALVGCGANSSSDANEATTNEATAQKDSSATNTEFPMTIKHAFGETVIDSEPKNIVTLSWANQDAILALGVVPVGVSAANYGKMTDNRLHPWTDDAFVALGEKTPNVFNDETGWDYEAIAACNPDVIIASYSGFTQEEYELLTQIAPVVPFAETAWKTNWREQTLTNSKAIGKAEEGEKLVSDTNELIKNTLANYPELEGKTAGYFWISQDDMSTFYAYLPADPRASYLNDLGLKTPESILNLAASTEDFSVTISRENADQLSDVDIMVVYGDEGLLEAMQADPLISQIPAVKNDAVALIDSSTALAAATTPSILSIPYAIDDYLSLLNEAASKVDAQ